MITVTTLQNRMDLFEDAVQTFWEKWGSGENYAFYEDCMRHSCHEGVDVPQFYLALQDDEIVGT